jgi:hypothetical protein
MIRGLIPGSGIRQDPRAERTSMTEYTKLLSGVAPGIASLLLKIFDSPRQVGEPDSSVGIVIVLHDTWLDSRQW